MTVTAASTEVWGHCQQFLTKNLVNSLVNRRRRLAHPFTAAAGLQLNDAGMLLPTEALGGYRRAISLSVCSEDFRSRLL